MCRHQCRVTRNMRKQGNMTPKEHNNFTITHPKEMEIHELSEKEFKIIILRKLSKIQENKDGQLRKTMYDQMKTLTKRLEL